MAASEDLEGAGLELEHYRAGGAILSMNQTNKEERSSAEPGEKRVRAKENIVQSNTNPTQCGDECPMD